MVHAPLAEQEVEGVGATLARATDAASAPDACGWSRVVAPIESIEHAAGEFFRLGAEAEVMAPTDLRAAVAARARAMAALYAG